MPHPVFEVGAGPVGDRHEIVAQRLDAGGGDRPDRLLVVLDIVLVAARPRFHILMHDDAFDHIPGQARSLDFRLAPGDLVRRPGTAVIQVMERADDARSACLAHMRQRHHVVRTEPAPGFPHLKSSFKVASAPFFSSEFR